jgi:hypothetical protein
MYKLSFLVQLGVLYYHNLILMKTGNGEMVTTVKQSTNVCVCVCVCVCARARVYTNFNGNVQNVPGSSA